MRFQSQLGLSLALSGLALSFLGCESAPSEAKSGIGEVCRYRNDCQSGLLCNGGVCVLGNADVAPDARSCDTIECNTNDDCCEISGTCRAYRRSCDAGDTVSCMQEQEFLRRSQCSDGECVTLECVENNDCVFSGRGTECRNNRCVVCDTDADCDTAFGCDDGNCACRNGACEERCRSNDDCPYFHACQSGDCVDVGCRSNRECIAAVDDPRAICSPADAQSTVPYCRIPCETDAECFSGNGDYIFLECINRFCTYVGCATDEECRIGQGSGSGNEMGDNVQAVCR